MGERKQGHFFRDAPSDFSRTHARRTDPATSHAAAESVVDITQSIQWQVMGVLIDADKPLAVEQIVDRMPHLEKDQVWRRVSDLKNKGWVEDSGELHGNRNGRSATRWRVTR